MILYGYYANPERTVGMSDPGISQPCVICGQPVWMKPWVSGDVDCGTRVYYYRVHAECANTADKAEVDKIIAAAIQLDLVAMFNVQKKELPN